MNKTIETLPYLWKQDILFGGVKVDNYNNKVSDYPVR